MSRTVDVVLRAATVAAAALALSCGGGKDGAGGGSGLAVKPSSLAFAADQNGPVPLAQTIQVTVSDPSAAYVVAGYPPGASVPTWLALSFTGAGSNWSLRATITGTGLAPGTYTATVRVAIARSDQSVITYLDAQVTYVVSVALTASPPSLTFTQVQGGATPAAQSVSLSGTAGLTWTASANQSWVVLGTASGTTPSSVPVSVNAAGLVPGSYSATISFSAAGKTATAAVSLTVTAPALMASAATLSYAGVNGAPLAAQSLGVSMNNGAAAAWSATAGAPWLVLSKASGTTPDTVSVSVNPAVGPLASGTYTSTVVFASGGSVTTATVNVSLSLTKAAFSFSPSAPLLGGASGHDLSPKAVLVGLNTGSNAYAWAATPSAAWTAVSSSTGTTSGTPVTVNLTPNGAGLTSGTRTGSVAFSATVNGDAISASLPVTFNLDTHKLLAAANGVALTSTPGLSRLTRAVRVTDNLGLSTPWSASSSQAWLSVTPSGTAGSDLVLTANPVGLAADSLYLATVSITSSDLTVVGPETVNVGVWVGSATPGPVRAAGAFAEVVTDPVRPYAYAHAGGATISVYHVHTGATVATIAGVGASLGGMAVAGDGSKLFAIDKTNFRIVPVNLADRTVGAAWNLVTTANTYPRLAYMRTNGLPLLVVTDGAVHGAADGAVLLSFAASSQVSASTLVASSSLGKAFCAVGCQSLDYTSLGGGTFLVAPLQGGGGSRDIALSADGSRSYGASGWPYYCTNVDTATGTLQQLGSGLNYPGNVEVGPDARIYCGRYATLSTENDVYVFDGTGAQLGSIRMADTSSIIGLLDRQLAISGDGLRAVGLVDDPALRIVTVP